MYFLQSTIKYTNVNSYIMYTQTKREKKKKKNFTEVALQINMTKQLDEVAGVCNCSLSMNTFKSFNTNILTNTWH